MYVCLSHLRFQLPSFSINTVSSSHFESIHWAGGAITWSLKCIIFLWRTSWSNGLWEYFWFSFNPIKFVRAKHITWTSIKKRERKTQSHACIFFHPRRLNLPIYLGGAITMSVDQTIEDVRTWYKCPSLECRVTRNSVIYFNPYSTALS